jgi:hypothetical protein
LAGPDAELRIGDVLPERLPHRDFSGKRHACIWITEFLIRRISRGREKVPANTCGDADIYQ